MPDAAKQKGLFISFEGGEGVGKSTHISYLAERLSAAGREVVCLREPGGTQLGEQLRALLLDPSMDMLSDAAELFLYEAARAQLVKECIKPALQAGKLVICDRYIDSTFAYQSAGRGLDPAFVHAANSFACSSIRPQRTILLQTSTVKDGLERALSMGDPDRLESLSITFHDRVQASFVRLAAEEPERIRLISSDRRASATATAIARELGDLLSEEETQALVDPCALAKLDAVCARA